jgi:hypothetical protein
VDAALKKLKAHIEGLGCGVPKVGPTKYNSCKYPSIFVYLLDFTALLLAYYFHTPISTLPLAAQVAMFLGIMCLVIASLSSRIGDMIMELLSMVVVLVAQNNQSQISDHRA